MDTKHSNALDLRFTNFEEFEVLKPEFVFNFLFLTNQSFAKKAQNFKLFTLVQSSAFCS